MRKAKKARCTQRLLACSLVVVNLLINIPLASGQTAAVVDAPLSTKPSRLEGFRLERLSVANGAELLTIFGPQFGNESDSGKNEVPLVSILRDTLGDSDPENDRMRYIWVLTYTKPTWSQNLAAAVPFLYGRAGKERRTANGVPPPVFDMAKSDKEVWNRFLWIALQGVLFDPYGMAVKASTANYRRNVSEYRKSQIVRALGALTLYQEATGSQSVFSQSEYSDIQARLSLNDKFFGGLVDEVRLQHASEKETFLTRDARGHNWELLRQRAEAEGLVFEPLELPDSSATHAMLWVEKSQLEANRGRKFHSRFLNIDNPWNDQSLRSWKGYTEIRFCDADGRRVEENTPGSRRVELIPLALYGLDQPNIPLLLVDFRDSLNPKKREMSRRVIHDVARNVLSLSAFGDLSYFLGRTLFDFVTGRRGMDVNQPSRVRTYSQLKLLLSLNASLEPGLRDQLSREIERVNLNPLENDVQAEIELARSQYIALVDYVKRPDGLAKRIASDRREEMVSLRHGRKERILFRIANIASFGLYTHRESPENTSIAQLDLNRRMKYHERYLREVAGKSTRVEIDSNVEEVKRSIRFVADHGDIISPGLTVATAKIFTKTDDGEIKELCLNGLYRVRNPVAKRELLQIYRDSRTEAKFKDQTAEYLRLAVKEDRKLPEAEARMILSVVGQ